MILITGGFGFIGAHVVREVLDVGEEVILTRHRSRELPPHLSHGPNGRLHAETVDVRDATAVAELLEGHAVESVIHLAAPPRSSGSAVEEADSAVNGLLAVLSACSRVGVRRLTVASSLRVYGNPPSPPVEEAQPLSLVSVDSIQSCKIAEESLGSYIAAQSDIEAVFLRVAVIYGPGYRSLINVPGRLCQLAAHRPDRIAGLPNPLEGHPDDSWDLCYVKDCARAIRMVHTTTHLAHSVYNVGTGSLTTLGDLVASLNKANPTLGLDVTSDGREARNGGPAMSIKRLQDDIGYSPCWDLTSGLSDYVDWLRTHER